MRWDRHSAANAMYQTNSALSKVGDRRLSCHFFQIPIVQYKVQSQTRRVVVSPSCFWPVGSRSLISPSHCGGRHRSCGDLSAVCRLNLVQARAGGKRRIVFSVGGCAACFVGCLRWRRCWWKGRGWRLQGCAGA